MRELIVNEGITLDGVIETGEWFSPRGSSDYDLSDVEAAIKEQREAADALLVGRRTFEDMREFWPRQTDDTTGTRVYLDEVHKYVISGSMGDTRWQNTTVLTGDALDEVQALKRAPGKDIVTTGSITLVHALIAAGLVDEYRLFIHPAVAGHGRRLFSDGTAIPAMRLIEARGFRCGMVLLRYRSE
ncbi:dihydrofolate reductase family protein [Pseudonocardia sp. DSM 110487]|uniref:dihydrofolate reductase family protein n=1 Tax=Pseudonocardia sp. DSM 110487 TaxID=2865833 RepID=UPI001C697F35|nr:dihydrofolate reductase family protein [Pseudonocardia sp. DSM 110487]QYN33610.1 dihydrofolate reductase family protein [Pseudonocardia sp. DSM 110487]